jgi:hypothetical protein
MMYVEEAIKSLAPHLKVRMYHGRNELQEDEYDAEGRYLIH